MNEDIDIDEVMRNRQIAKKMASKLASKGNPIAGMLAELENVASPFFLGIDADENAEDLGVTP